MEADEYRRMAEVEDAHWWYRATRALLRQEIEPLLVPGGRFLDAGGGTGATGAWLAEHGRLVACDAVAPALVANRSLHPALRAAAVGDLVHLPFQDDAFDLALCVTVLYHQAIADPVAAVRELARTVRPGGVVVLMEPGVRRLRRAHDRVTHGARRFSRRDLRTVAESAGLVVQRATGAHSYLVPPAALKAVLERGEAASDLDGHQSGLGGVLGMVARAERAVLRRTALPAGLSVLVVARVP